VHQKYIAVKTKFISWKIKANYSKLISKLTNYLDTHIHKNLISMTELFPKCMKLSYIYKTLVGEN